MECSKKSTFQPKTLSTYK